MLRQFHQSLLQDLSGVRAVTCYVAKLYHLTQVRNALLWSRRSSSLGPQGYQENLPAAKQAAGEQSALPGSEAWIREVPCIVIRGGNHCVLLAPKSSLTPFEEFSDCEFRTSLMATIVSQAVGLGYVFFSDYCPEPAEHPFRSLTSKSGDAKRPVIWKDRPESRDLSDLQELLSKLQDAIAVEKWMTAGHS